MADKPAFAVWITGLPASGKSTIARELEALLREFGVDAARLESDTLRKIASGDPHYDPHGRDAFYRLLTWIGTLLVRHGVPVIFDATANRSAYRDSARQEIPRFVEVYVECPLEVCMARDPKGVYRQATLNDAGNVPGLQEPYEAPQKPDVLAHGDIDRPGDAARKIVAVLKERNYI